jgi:murein DD-endopeptidase MepM/ murein hydrolase activator NlpD
VAEETIADDGFAAVADPHDAGVAASPPPPAAGARTHIVRRGDTLYSLARRYGVSVTSLMRANGISEPRRVPVGMRLAIPGSAPEPPRADRKPGGAGRKQARADRKGGRGPAAPPMDKTRPAETPVQAASVLPLPAIPRAERIDPERGAIPAPPQPGTGGLALAWPLGGRLTGSFGMRGRSKHEGIDIDGRKGQTVRAAAAGIVERTGEDGKYGKMVLIDHGGGITTLYAHASRILVKPGDRVERNEPIAEVGRTGNASGHHLHFEMRRDGRPIDPLPALRHGVLRPPAREASAR